MERLKKSPMADGPGDSHIWVYTDKVNGVAGRMMLDTEGRWTGIQFTLGMTVHASKEGEVPTVTHNASMHLSEEMALALREVIDLLLTYQNAYAVVTVGKKGLAVLYGDREG